PRRLASCGHLRCGLGHRTYDVLWLRFLGIGHLPHLAGRPGSRRDVRASHRTLACLRAWLLRLPWSCHEEAAFEQMDRHRWWDVLLDLLGPLSDVHLVTRDALADHAILAACGSPPRIRPPRASGRNRWSLLLRRRREALHGSALVRPDDRPSQEASC